MRGSNEKILDLQASKVEACRICLATDVKLYNLRDPNLETCINTLTRLSNESYDGLPEYVCYQCAPCLVKFYKFIEKTKAAQTTLMHIFEKNEQITKSLIEEQNRSQLNLQSSLDSFLLLNYFYIKYDDDNNTSDFVKTDSDPKQININLKNEIKEDPTDEVSDSEILQILNNSIAEVAMEKAKMDSDSEVEAIDVKVPVVEIVSDDEKMGDDFISLTSYKVKTDDGGPGGKFRNSNVRYRKPKGKGIAKKYKKKQKGKRLDTLSYVDPNETYVQKFFNVNVIPVAKTASKKYSCKFCPKTFDFIEEAKDHTFIGCTNPQIIYDNTPAYTKPVPTNSAMSNEPRIWKEWPGDKKL